jgi:Spy/CpxP family protein refolding chaperone
MRGIRSTALAALALGVVATTAAAQAPAPPPPPSQEAPHPHRGGGKFQQRLGLTDDQMNAIRQVHEQQRDMVRQHAQALRQANADLRRLALSGGDAAAIQAKEAEVQNHTAQLLALRVQALQQIGPILTPEQREKFAQMHMGGWHHGRSRMAPQSS